MVVKGKKGKKGGDDDVAPPPSSLGDLDNVKLGKVRCSFFRPPASISSNQTGPVFEALFLFVQTDVGTSRKEHPIHSIT